MATALSPTGKVIRVASQDAHAFVVSLLEASGVTRQNADMVAHGLVQADLRGVESHGINRMPSYLARIRNGVLDPKAEPTLEVKTPVVAQVGAAFDPCLFDGVVGGYLCR